MIGERRSCKSVCVYTRRIFVHSEKVMCGVAAVWAASSVCVASVLVVVPCSNCSRSQNAGPWIALVLNGSEY